MDLKILMKQCVSGNLEALKAFHREHPEMPLDALRYDASGDTILHHVAQLGHAEIAHFLLDHFFVDCRNKDNKTALHVACQFGQLDVANLLLERNADVNALKKSDWTPLMLACTKIQGRRSPMLIATLIQHGAMLNFRNKDGWNALHLICREGSPEILRYLLSRGADASMRTKNGNTALHVAALHAHPECWQLLIEHHPDAIHARNHQGNLPLHEAVLSKSLDMVRECLQHYSKQEATRPNSSGFNIMHLAAFIGALDIVAFLSTLGYLDIHQKTNEGQNCLHLAARNTFWNIYAFCQALGMKEAEDMHGRQPFDYNQMPANVQ